MNQSGPKKAQWMKKTHIFPQTQPNITLLWSKKQQTQKSCRFICPLRKRSKREPPSIESKANRWRNTHILPHNRQIKITLLWGEKKEATNSKIMPSYLSTKKQKQRKPPATESKSNRWRNTLTSFHTTQKQKKSHFYE